MKRAIQKNGHLGRSALICRLGAGVCILGALCAAGAGVYCIGKQPTYSGILAALGASAIFAAWWLLRKGRILQSGMAGEKAAAKTLQGLPASYTVISGLYVRGENGHPHEMDFVIVGPNGVLVVETKHHRGRMVGDVQGAQWKQEKQGSGGAQYTQSFYSPVKQVRTHVHHLAKVLQAGGQQVWVQGVVYFSHPQATLSITGAAGCDVPILCASKDNLVTALRKIPSQGALSPQRRAQICKILGKHI